MLNANSYAKLYNHTFTCQIDAKGDNVSRNDKNANGKNGQDPKLPNGIDQSFVG